MTEHKKRWYLTLLLSWGTIPCTSSFLREFRNTVLYYFYNISCESGCGKDNVLVCPRVSEKVAILWRPQQHSWSLTYRVFKQWPRKCPKTVIYYRFQNRSNVTGWLILQRHKYFTYSFLVFSTNFALIFPQLIWLNYKRSFICVLLCISQYPNCS